MKRRIVLIAEHSEGILNPVTHELVSLAQELEAAEFGTPMLLVLGKDVAALAAEAGRGTGLDVLAIEVPGFDSYNSEVYKTVLASALKTLNPAFVCAAHTTTAADFAPGLAVRLDAACITSVEAVRKVDGRLLFARSVMGGKAQALMVSTTDVTVVTVQPGKFKRAVAGSGAGQVEIRSIPCTAKNVQSLGIKAGPSSDSSLSEAKVIVSAGRGVKEREILDLVFDLSKMFPQSAVACSRPLCDAGWLKYKHQVGLTGATVSPELYLACGISGAQQHIVGMQGSSFVVAINTDPHAAIFNHADVCIVEDLVRFLPELIKCLARSCE